MSKLDKLIKRMEEFQKHIENDPHFYSQDYKNGGYRALSEMIGYGKFLKEGGK